MDNVKFVVGKTYLCVLQMNMQRANELVQVPGVGAENEAGPPQVAACGCQRYPVVECNSPLPISAMAWGGPVMWLSFASVGDI